MAVVRQGPDRSGASRPWFRLLHTVRALFLRNCRSAAGHRDGKLPDTGAPPDDLTAGTSSVPRIQPPRDMPGQIGRYRVRAWLGGGAFGDVYQAYDPQLDRDVALKVPRAGSLDSPGHVQRFLTEARSAAQLRHPHIVPTFDAGHDGTHFYIASAFVRGRTLEAVTEEGRLDARRAAGIVRDLAEALAYAHSLGVVHRDVKPSNVLLDEQGQPHLMDFGLARRRDSVDARQPAKGESPWWQESQQQKCTQEGDILGTPAYMSPEQAAGRAHKVGPASDQYNLGVVLYELLCGRVPFEGPVPVILYNTVHGVPEPPRQVDPAVPRDLEAVCRKALAKSPGDRYGGCQDLADDLRRWLEGEPIKGRRPGPRERLVRWCQREPRLAFMTTVALGLLVAAATVALVNARLQRHAAHDADEARRQEELARLAAEEKERLTEQARAETEAQKREADRLRAEAEEGRRRLEVSLYFNHIALADLALRDRNPARAWDLLEQCPKPLRQWEWYHLVRLYHKHQLTAGHPTDEVNAVAFSPDGAWLVFANQDDTVKVWDAATGKEVFSLRGHTGAVRCLAFSPDGKLLASAGRDKTVKVWDLATRRPRTLRGHGDTVRCLAFSPDGKLLASAALDRTVKVWDLAAPEEGPLTIPHPAAVTSVTFSLPGKSPGELRLASACAAERAVRTWDPRTGRLLAEPFRGYTGGAFSPDGARIALVREDHTVLVLPVDPRLGQGTVPLRGHRDAIHAVAFSPDGKRLATASEDQSVRVWDPATGKELANLKGHSEGVTGVTFGRDGRVASAGKDQTVRVWNLATGQSDVYGAGDAPVQRNLRRPESLTLQEYDNHTHAVAFSPDGRLLATASSVARSDSPGFAAGEVKVWNVATGQELHTFTDLPGRIWSLAFNASGERLALAGKDPTVTVRDVRSGKTLRTLAGHAGAVECVAWSHDGSFLATAGEDRTVRVWNAAKGTEINVLSGHGGTVHAVAFAPDGRRLASAGADGTVRLWEAITGRELFTLRRHNGSVNGVAFAADGRLLASAGDDRTLVLWDAGTGKEVRTLHGHTGRVIGAAFNAGGGRLASTAEDRAVKLWDVPTGQEVLTVKGNMAFSSSPCFSPDGQRLAAGGGDGVKLLDASPFKLGEELTDLIAALKDPDREVRSVARRDLVRRGRPAVAPLREALHDAQLRSEAALVLAEFTPPVEEVLPDLVAGLGGGDNAFRLAAQHALLRMGKPAVPALCEVLEGAEAAGWPPALVVLGQLGPQARAAVPVIARLLPRATGQVRVLAVTAIVEIDPTADGALAALRAAFPDPEEEVRVTAELGLVKAGRPAVPVLAELLQHPDAVIRRRAIAALETINPAGDWPQTRAALPALLRRLTDADRAVRDGAAHLLARAHPRIKASLPVLQARLAEKRTPTVPRSVKRNFWTLEELLEQVGPEVLVPNPEVVKEAETRGGEATLVVLLLVAGRDKTESEVPLVLLHCLDHTTDPKARRDAELALQLAQGVYQDGNRERGRNLYREVIRDYPATDAAEKCRQLLKADEGR
jgi:WD40 repeat protein/HEAT repeat protein